MVGMSAGGKAIALATEFCKLTESFEAIAYADPLNSDGLPITAGYGSTRRRDGSPFTLGEVITQEEADYLLMQDIQQFSDALLYTPYWAEMHSGQQAALISLAYNKGLSHQDSLDAALKNRNWNDVGEILLKYTNGGQLGLMRRRKAEWLMWCGKTPQEAYRAAWK